MAKKEFKVGEEFQCGLIKLKCEANLDFEECYFKGIDYCCTTVYDIVGACDRDGRTDKTNVAFVKVDE